MPFPKLDTSERYEMVAGDIDCGVGVGITVGVLMGVAVAGRVGVGESVPCGVALESEIPAENSEHPTSVSEKVAVNATSMKYFRCMVVLISSFIARQFFFEIFIRLLILQFEFRRSNIMYPSP